MIRTERKFSRMLLVSILVLVDFVRNAFTEGAVRKYEGSFNPCFSGFCSECYAGYLVRFAVGMFQSLFQWILFGMAPNHVRQSKKERVSILVLVDFVRNALEQFSRSFHQGSFQSLFQWILFGMPDGYSIYISPGLVFQSLFQWILFGMREIGENSAKFRFVSILVLVDFVRNESQHLSMTDKFSVSILVLVDFVRNARWEVPSPPAQTVFQSLFQWILFGMSNTRNANAPHGQKFQSLFQWILFGMNANQITRLILKGVSILVLVDFVRNVITQARSGTSNSQFQSLFQWILFGMFTYDLPYGSPKDVFQSLFQWILFGMTRALTSTATAANVSILVLVDFVRNVLLLQCRKVAYVRFNPCFSGFCSECSFTIFHTDRQKMCFNPCFSGFCSECFERLRAAKPQVMFQSLFQWILFGMVIVHVSENEIRITFQSLFQWILFGMQAPPGGPKPGILRFNPCFSGFCSECTLACRQFHSEPQFQSLFQWILFGMAFGGSANRRLRTVSILVLVDFVRNVPHEDIEHLSDRVFQSLFQWILFGMEKALTPTTERRQVSILVLVDFVRNALSRRPLSILECTFQSLFQWILFGMTFTEGRNRRYEGSFNPCFSGFCSEWSRLKSCRPSGGVVSILVLVDFVRNAICSRSTAQGLMQFQSLFQWILFGMQGQRPRRATSSGVSILVLVDFVRNVKTFKTIQKTLTSFNPCFSGFCSECGAGPVSQRHDEKFQSLFQWILFGMPGETILYTRYTMSFNPCFSGFCSECLMGANAPDRKEMFQSLFQWILFGMLKTKRTNNFF